MNMNWHSEHEPCPPPSINDPIAAKTSWSPINSVASTFRTHKLIPINSERLEFHSTFAGKFLDGMFLTLGFFLMGLMVVSIFKADSLAATVNFLLPLFMGLIFMLLGGAMLYRRLTPIIFDSATGFFWKGRQAPNSFTAQSNTNHVCRLDRIHALQLLSQSRRNRKTRYHSYQLNLILKDGRRINVINHNRSWYVRSDAAMLAAFLRIRVWDGI